MAPIENIRRLPKRIAELTLPEPYNEFHATCWINAPRSLWLEATSQDEATVTAALQQIVVGHDLCDFNGDPYPPADDPEFWNLIPTEVGAVIISAIQSQVGRLPKPKDVPS